LSLCDEVFISIFHVVNNAHSLRHFATLELHFISFS